MKPRVNVLLRSEQTNGVLAVMDNRMSAGAQGPPLHLHDFDETFYVLDGELTFQLGDELHTKRAGELAFAAGGVAHTFANLSDADARVLLVCTPGGFERHFDRVAAREDGVEPPPEAAGPIPEVTRVGPRIGDSGLLPAPPAAPAAQRPVRPDAPFHPAVLVHGSDSAARLSVIEVAAGAGFEGPPLHHHDFDETFYVLDGELTFQVVDQLITKCAGELVFAPRGVDHTLANLSGAPARYLLMCTPAGFERYFMRVEAEQTGVQPPPEALGPVPEAIVVGPQIAAR